MFGESEQRLCNPAISNRVLLPAALRWRLSVQGPSVGRIMDFFVQWNRQRNVTEITYEIRECVDCAVYGQTLLVGIHLSIQNIPTHLHKRHSAPRLAQLGRDFVMHV